MVALLLVMLIGISAGSAYYISELSSSIKDLKVQIKGQAVVLNNIVQYLDSKDG